VSAISAAAWAAGGGSVFTSKQIGNINGFGRDQFCLAGVAGQGDHCAREVFTVGGRMLL
jgi:hypothetical protein